MTHGGTLALLAATHLGAAMSPGANTPLVVETADHRRAPGFATAAGAWPAGAFWSATRLAGLHLLRRARPPHVECHQRASGLDMMGIGARLVSSP